MANKFFLVGHGVGYTNSGEVNIPANVTVKFAVPAGWRSTGTVSTACMRGEFTEFAEVVSGPTTFPQHFLCPDTPETHLNKLIAFHQGVSKLPDKRHIWLLCVRGAYEITLTAIISRLEELGLSKPYELIWTCCRSPINEVSPGTLYFKDGNKDPKSVSAAHTTKSPTDERNKIMSSAAAGILTIISGDDVISVPKNQFGKATLGRSKSEYESKAIFGVPHTTPGDTLGLGYVPATDGAKGMGI